MFRNYSALIVVVSSALLVSATNLAAGKESSGFLFGYFGDSDNYENPLANKMSLQASKKADLAMVQLAPNNTIPDPSNREKVKNESLNMQGQALVAATGPVREDPEEDGGVKIYEVQSGDTISSIAVNNHITINTILWANSIDNIDSIKPGDKIFILPVAGLSYTVKSGDSLESIAKKYKADRDKIIAFNDLPANGDLANGQEIVIPGGEKELIAPRPATVSPSSPLAARPYESFTAPGKKLDGRAGTGHRFPYGYCTWYVAQKRYIPWGGNAGTWLYRAKALGYSTGRSPKVGSIIVTTEDRRYGHVALVEKVSGGTITVSEMNYVGWGKKSFRTLDANSRVIKGFIY